jgi:hypothetical protein
MKSTYEKTTRTMRPAARETPRASVQQQQQVLFRIVTMLVMPSKRRECQARRIGR